MRGLIIKRLLQMVLTLFIVSLIVFFMVRLKGDPISVMAPPTFNEEQIARMREVWGFDKPLTEQYIIFITKAITGDFGQSIQARRPAMELVIERLGNTYLLAMSAALSGLAIALPLGILSAVKRNSLIDVASSMLASLGNAMPNFWLGLMLIIIFSVNLRILPAFGALEPAALIMPTVTLAVGTAARLSRVTRSAMLEVLNQDYIRTALSKGLRSRQMLYRHALRNALIPIITVFGLQLGWLLGGSVVVESVFSWPGLGRLMIESINVRDITVVQAGLFWFSLSFILINFAVDMLYVYLDPRIHYN
ncbi:ABC transporter permease [Anaerolineae bacterium CFX9]|jgi:ABC-type dipeptide/oligopeptide/nickel transport system permease component|nr:ABC transporter permease [Oscillatoria laete-virens]MDL1899510.1 ABC transporter permease [Anaerolineae bacterium CFX9]MDL5055630.1 ABC transporter permease [Oscillatoria laete-virens NRMC-F 0139]